LKKFIERYQKQSEVKSLLYATTWLEVGIEPTIGPYPTIIVASIHSDCATRLPIVA
jgi:hypothetical protein